MSQSFQPGRYVGTIVKSQLTEAKSGTAQVAFTVMPKAIIINGQSQPCPQFERTVFMAVTENTIDFVARDLVKLGYPHDSFDQLDPSHPQAHSFAGREVSLSCAHETYQGKTREKWSFFLGGEGPKQLEKTGLGILNAKFGSKLKETRVMNPQFAAPATAAVAAPAAKTTEQEAEEVF